jgi:hypothetical protein
VELVCHKIGEKNTPQLSNCGVFLTHLLTAITFRWAMENLIALGPDIELLFPENFDFEAENNFLENSIFIE